MSGHTLDRSVFAISIDLELAWGFILYRQHEALALLKSDPKRARGTIDILLGLLERYDIPASWAVVGHLFLDPDRKEELIHEEMPQFKEGWIDWGYYCGLRNDPLYYGKDIVERILASSVGHEIGLHGFFHMPFHRCSRRVAEVELELGTKLARGFGVEPVSFVFPGNGIGHLDVLRDYGLQIYRGQDAGRHCDVQYHPIREFCRARYKLIAPPVLPTRESGIWEVPSSTYFCDPRFPFTLLPRARLGLERAIRASKVFHIYLHLWNLLFNKRLAGDLERFLAAVARERDRGRLEVMTMGALPDYRDRKGRVGL